MNKVHAQNSIENGKTVRIVVIQGHGITPRVFPLSAAFMGPPITMNRRVYDGFGADAIRP